MHNYLHRIIAIRHRLDLHLALKNGIGVVQNGVDGMRSIPVPGEIEPRGARANDTPIMMTRRILPSQWRGLPSSEISSGAVGFQGSRSVDVFRRIELKATQVGIGSFHCPLPRRRSA